jgi:hypothetical protein
MTRIYRSLIFNAMKTASIAELKQELNALSPKALKELCLRLAKYRKENKELLTYLLFEAGQEEEYIRGVKEETDEAFLEINRSSLYFAKKTLRKILRNTNKYIKYSGSKQTEVELLLYYCTKLKDSGIPFADSPALLNLYQRQVEKVAKSMAKLHEDLQYDYQETLDSLLIF